MKESLFLGVSRGDITPDTGGQLYGYNPYLRSESIHDRLSAAAFYFSYAKEKALLISICVCLITTSLADSLRADISECTGVPAENIFRTYVLGRASAKPDGPNREDRAARPGKPLHTNCSASRTHGKGNRPSRHGKLRASRVPAPFPRKKKKKCEITLAEG